MFIDTIIITSDRTGADINTRPNFTITNITQMIYLTAGSNTTFFNFNKITNMNFFR